MFDDVYKFLIGVLADMNYDTSEITPQTDLGSDGLDLESLSIAEISIQVEDTYSVKFDEDEAEQLALMTLGSLVEEIIKRAAAVTR